MPVHIKIRSRLVTQRMTIFFGSQCGIHSLRARESQTESHRENQREPKKFFQNLSYSLWLFLTLSDSLWLSLALSLSLSLWICLTLSDSLFSLSDSVWLSLILSGSRSLRICLQSPCLAHKTLTKLVVSLLRYSSLISSDIYWHYHTS